MTKIFSGSIQIDPDHFSGIQIDPEYFSGIWIDLDASRYELPVADEEARHSERDPRAENYVSHEQ